MKKFLAVFLILTFTATGLAADPAESSFRVFGWSWSEIKTAVKEKVSNWWAGSAQTEATKPQEQAQVKPPSTQATQNPAPSKTVQQTTNIKQAEQQVKAIQVSRVATPGVVSHDKNLVMGKDKIPVFEFKRLRSRLDKVKVKKIPLLNVGTESTLDASAFQTVSIDPFPSVAFEAVKALQEPEVESQAKFKEDLGASVVKAPPAEKIEIPILEAGKKVTREKIDKLVYALAPEPQIQVLPVQHFTAEQLKLLRALILVDKKDQCHLASGLFSDLTESEDEDVRNNSNLHLGLCLHEMNLPTEAYYRLGKVFKSHNTKYIKAALPAFVDDVPLQFESEVAEALLNLKEEGVVPPESQGVVNYLKAKYFVKKSQPQKAVEFADKVPSKTRYYYKAQYIAAVAEYEMKKVDSSLARQKKIASDADRKDMDKDVLALAEINIGRMAFQKAKYKESLEAYQKIPKEHPLWMQALTEQAWAQLQSKDAAGAIGNMHSIHSPYFDNVFKPESYIVRSIGYLNICQYADAQKSLGYLESRYAPWLEKINTYNKTHNDAQTFQTVLRYLQSKPNTDIDNLPFQFIREAARQRDYLNIQEGINQLVDENGGYTFIRNMIDKDRKNLLSRRVAAISQIAFLKQKIKKAKTGAAFAKNVEQWKIEMANHEEFLQVYDFKMKTYNEGYEGFRKFMPQGQERAAFRKDQLKVQAGTVLRKHFNHIAKNLASLFDNNELLKYEVYAGSGENLRYQVAGGKVGSPSKNAADRNPAGVHWDFSGEYWEDEIGHYRSSLKNNCQNSEVAAKKE